MNEIRIFLYLLIFVISVVNMIRFYTRKSKQKDLSQTVSSRLKSDRTLTAEEASALEYLYKTPFKAGMPIQKVSGEVERNELTVGGGTADAVLTIGRVMIFPQEWLFPHLEEINEAEIVDFGHKKGAAVLSLNSRFNAVHETGVPKALEEGKSYTKKSDGEVKGFEITPGRELTPEEEYYVRKDRRILPAILFAVLLAASVIIPDLTAKALAAAAALALLLLVMLPSSPRSIGRKKLRNLINISGTLEKVNDSLIIGRHNILLPEGWEKRVTPGQRITAEAFPEDKTGIQLRVMSLNGIYSLKRELAKEPVRKNDRFLSMAICSGLALILMLFAGDIVNKGVQTVRYGTTRSMTSAFDSLESLREYPLKEGQELNLSGLTWIPAPGMYSAVYLMDPETPALTEIPDAAERIRILDEVQMTEEMFMLAAIAFSDDMWIYDFYDEYYPLSYDQYLPSMDLFGEYYSESRGYQLLRELMDAYDALPEEAETSDSFTLSEDSLLYKEMSYGMIREDFQVSELVEMIPQLLRAFIEEQTDLVNTAVETAFTNYLKESGALYYESGQEIPGMEDYFQLRLDTNDLRKFNLSRGYGFNSAEVYMNENPGEKLRENLAGLSVKNSSSFSGVIWMQGTDGLGTPAIYCQKSDYGNIPRYIADLVLLLLGLLVLAWSIISLVTGKKTKKD